MKGAWGALSACLGRVLLCKSEICPPSCYWATLSDLAKACRTCCTQVCTCPHFHSSPMPFCATSISSLAYASSITIAIMEFVDCSLSNKVLCPFVSFMQLSSVSLRHSVKNCLSRTLPSCHKASYLHSCKHLCAHNCLPWLYCSLFWSGNSSGWESSFS